MNKSTPNINDIIVECVNNNNIQRHSDLVKLLKEQWKIELNQSTLSRKLVSLNIKKIGGYYAKDVIQTFNKPKISFTSSSPNMIIAKTPPGHAGAVAHNIDHTVTSDRFLMSRIKGTIAGDDTIFIVTDGISEIEKIVQYLKKHI